jgi:hypothetical protein
MRSIRILAAALGVSMMLATSAAHAAEQVTITQAHFSPDLRGMPTNAIGSATISSTTGVVPSPITHVNVFGPAGLSLDLTGSLTCTEQLLEEKGSEACPARSLAGTGGGLGVYELAGEMIEEDYRIEFFLENNDPGHVEMLVYLTGHSPVIIERIFKAFVVEGHTPYGLGFSLEVPLIKVLPEASDASARTASISLGAHGLTYIAKVHGKRVRRPIRGIVLPRTCPAGGWPIESEFSFQDESHVTAKKTIPCPRRG